MPVDSLFSWRLFGFVDLLLLVVGGEVSGRGETRSMLSVLEARRLRTGIVTNGTASVPALFSVLITLANIVSTGVLCNIGCATW